MFLCYLVKLFTDTKYCSSTVIRIKEMLILLDDCKLNNTFLCRIKMIYDYLIVQYANEL